MDPSPCIESSTGTSGTKDDDRFADGILDQYPEKHAKGALIALTDPMGLKTSEEAGSSRVPPRDIGLDAVVCVIAVFVGALCTWVFYVLSEFVNGGPIDVSAVIFFSIVFIITVVPGLLGAGLAVVAATVVRRISSSGRSGRLEAFTGAGIAGVVTLVGIFSWSGMIEVVPVAMTGLLVVVLTGIALKWSDRVAARRFELREKIEAYRING